MELTGNRYAAGGWRKLLATRRGTVLVAAACALAAGGIIVFAMQSYRNNVDAEGNPETVLVASGLIQKGTSGDAIAAQQLFTPKTYAAKQVSSGAIVDTSLLHGKVAAADIEPGQQLTGAEFTSSGGLPGELAPNQRAMTITVDSARGMVGNVKDGDRVDVYADLEPGGGRTAPFVRLLMANVPVLKAGSGGGGVGLGATSNPANQQSNVTLKVDTGQAGALAYASDNGKVWLVLRPANAAASGSSPTVSVQSLLSSPASSGGGK